MPQVKRKRNILIIVSLVVVLLVFSMSETSAISVVEFGDDNHGQDTIFTPNMAYSVQGYGYNGTSFHSLDCIHVRNITVYLSAINSIPKDQQGQELFNAATLAGTKINGKRQPDGGIIYGEDYSVETPEQWVAGPNVVEIIIHQQTVNTNGSTVRSDSGNVRLKAQTGMTEPISVIKEQYVVSFTVTIIDDMPKEDEEYIESIVEETGQSDDPGALDILPAGILGGNDYIPRRDRHEARDEHRLDTKQTMHMLDNSALSIVKRVEPIYMVRGDSTMPRASSTWQTAAPYAVTALTIIILLLMMSIISDLAVLRWHVSQKRKQ